MNGVEGRILDVTPHGDGTVSFTFQTEAGRILRSPHGRFDPAPREGGPATLTFGGAVWEATSGSGAEEQTASGSPARDDAGLAVRVNDRSGQSTEDPTRARAHARARARIERAKACRPRSKDERIAAIILIGPDAWRRGETGPELAEAWDVSADVVEKDAVEAWRIMRFQEAGWVRRHLNTSLAEALEWARTYIQPTAADEEDDFDHLGRRRRKTSSLDVLNYSRAITSIAETWAPLAGVQLPNKNQVNIHLDDHPQLQAAVMKQFETIEGALQPYPEALAAVRDALLDLAERQRGDAPALGGG